MFLQKIQYLLHGLHMVRAFIFDVKKDIMQVNNDKNIELLGQDLFDVALKVDRSIR